MTREISLKPIGVVAETPVVERTSRHVFLGIAAAMCGSAVFSLNDLCIKHLSGAYALHQVILVRAFVGVAFILGFAAVSGQRRIWYTKRPWMHLLRSSIVMISNATYFLGLAALPLADAAAIGFVAPLLLTMLSVLILREKVGWHRWGAVVVGLIGVVVMLRPEGQFRWAAVLVLISALCYATTQTMTRMFRDTESAVTINFYTQVAFVVVSSSMGLFVGDGHLAGSPDASLAFLFRPWILPVEGDWIYFLGTGLAVAIGGLLMSQAYRMNEAALVAPFEYTSMPLAILWGFVFFGTFPDLQGWVGIALIIGAGLYTLWRETVRRHGR
ncbi:EamA family transporter [bacterium]|nr:EamA family transporter [bacterium]